MIPELSAARRAAFEAGRARPVGTESVPLSEAPGRALATEVRALVELPPFDNAAMDGWVVGGAGPWRLGARIPTGAGTSGPVLREGEARAISTGAPVPPGTTAVLRREDGEERGRTLHQLGGEPLPEGRHIRRRGEETGRGDVVCAAGATATPPVVALLAAAGLDEVTVRRPLPVELVVTGDEVVDSGVPGPGKVRDAFSTSLPSVLESWGARVVTRRLAADDPGALGTSPAPLLVTTGGTSRGSGDAVGRGIRAAGRLLVDGIAAHPGRPVLLAERPDGGLHLALPGNPLAALLALVVLGPPLLAGAHGQPIPVLGSADVRGRLENDRPTVRLLPVHAEPEVRPVPWTGSAMLRGLAIAQGVAVVPPGGAAVGDRVDLLPLPW